jgi:hypothetical protein
MPSRLEEIGLCADKRWFLQSVDPILGCDNEKFRLLQA